MYKLLFLILALFFIRCILNNNTENFTDDTALTESNISDYIYKVYKADIKAIQNLADIAIKIQAGGLSIPGSVTVQRNLNVKDMDANTLIVNNTTTVRNNLENKGVLNLNSVIVDGDLTINNGDLLINVAKYATNIYIHYNNQVYHYRPQYVNLYG